MSATDLVADTKVFSDSTVCVRWLIKPTIHLNIVNGVDDGGLLVCRDRGEHVHAETRWFLFSYFFG